MTLISYAGASHRGQIARTVRPQASIASVEGKLAKREKQLAEINRQIVDRKRYYNFLKGEIEQAEEKLDQVEIY